MADNTSIPIIVQGNSFSLAIPLQIYVIDGTSFTLEDYTPDITDVVSVQLKGSRRSYTYTPTITGNIAYIELGGYELADNYGVVVSIVKASGQRLRSFRTDQFFIVESSDDLTQADIVAGLEENVIYLNSTGFIAGEDGRGIVSIVKTSTSGLVDTYTITYTDNTTSTFDVTNGAQGDPGASIASIAKTSTSGLVDTYTITLTNGNTSTFEVTNGMNGVDLGLANIVNDLTTGGATNVLSAEMGKELKEGVTKDGMSYSTFDHSTFTAQTPSITLANNIVLAQAGDYIEIKVKAGDTEDILRHPASYQSPEVKYSASNTLYIRFVNDLAQWTYQNSAVDNTKVQVIKILLDSVSDTTYNFKIYLDGNQVGTPSITTSKTIQYSLIGYNSTMDLYYIKGKSNGTDFDFTEFSKFSGATGVTDVYDTTNVPSLHTLDTRLAPIENMVGSDMYYYYKKVSTVYAADSSFTIFQRLYDNVYLRTLIILYNPPDTSAPKGYWRMERSAIVSLVDGEFTTIQDQVLTPGENEFVMQWLDGESYNYSGGYSGGYHVGEKIGDTGSFVEFVADGNIVDLSADIPLTPCKSFYYKELSAIYQKSAGTIACWHYKETHLKDGGYETMNEIKLTQALDYFAYFGICCVGRNVSEYAMPENTPTATDMGDGSTTIAQQFLSHNHRIHYEGNGYGVDVESKVLYGDDDSLNELVVYNSSSYNKFYRRTQDIDGSTLNRACGITKVKFFKMKE